METLLAFVIGGLYATGIYLMLQRTLAQLIFGLALLTNAANLLIFTAAGLTRGRPPLIAADMDAPEPPFADPLPQALILTAIVIGFGVLAFALVLAYRTYQTVGSDDLDDMKTTDELKRYEDTSHPEAPDEYPHLEHGKPVPAPHH
jgi:multicomponent Na+:H+ antiporter subunit C